MKNDVLYTALKTGSVEVTFTKVNGDKRVMQCTLKEDVIPSVTGEGKSHVDTNVAVWDLNKQAWRSFRWDSVDTWRQV
jgi:hypothetical protein